MKDLVVLVLVLLILFMIWNGRATGTTTSTYAAGDVNLTAPVPLNIVQAIIEKVQSMKPDMAPIDTTFVNVQPDGSYNSRIMFYNTKHFFGTQYDISAKVNADGSVDVLKIGDSSEVDPSAGYKPDSYMPWASVQDTMTSQFKGALKGYKNQPVQPSLQNVSKAYNQDMIMSESNLMTRF
jgi:hypothetical protein